MMNKKIDMIKVREDCINKIFGEHYNYDEITKYVKETYDLDYEIIAQQLDQTIVKGSEIVEDL